MSQPRAVIIGAGIGGIATANLLAKAGCDVSVYEKNNQPGGRAGMLVKDGFRFDTGPSWYLMPEVFDHYFSLFGRKASRELDLIRLTPAYKVFFEDTAPLTIESDLDKVSTLFEHIEPGAGSALHKYVMKSDRIYRLSLQHFLYSNFTDVQDFTKPEILRHGLTMARLATTSLDAYASRFVRDLRLRQILEYPSVFLGTSPFKAPALYSLMSALDFKEGVFYPKGGMYTIIERLMALSKELGVSYHFSSPVARIMTHNGHAHGIALQDGRHVAADIVIANADLHHTETSLLEAPDRTYSESYWDTKEPGPSALLCYLGIKGKLPELEHHNLFFTTSWKANFDAIYKTPSLPWPASYYLCKPSATDQTVAPKNTENVFALIPLPAGIRLNGAEQSTLGDLYLAHIQQTTGITDLAKRVVSKTYFGPDDFRTRFHAWRATALGPSHILRQSAFFRTHNKSKRLDNLYYVGGFTTPGIGLPMCLISAELVYKRLINDNRGGPVSEIRAFETSGGNYD